MNILYRNNINIIGSGRKAMMFVHGFGSDHSVWRHITPAFEEEFKIILIDLVGSGKSDTLSYDENKYNTLQGYADDIIEICQFLKLSEVTCIGHAVGGIISALAVTSAPKLFKNLVLVASTPYYISNDSYAGGYSKKKLDEMLRLIDNDYMGWAVSIAPRLAGEQEKTELSKEIANTLCHTDPEIALHFARTTMLSDYRKHLKKLKLSTLIIQPEDDMLVDMEVGDYIQQNIPYSEMVILKSKGHYPQLSNPKEIISALRIFL